LKEIPEDKQSALGQLRLPFFHFPGGTLALFVLHSKEGLQNWHLSGDGIDA
jgi:hypothetical protein